MMWITALLPFLAQAIVMFFDEFYFHVRRGLPKWERVGHPLDTMTVILCMAYVVWIPFSTNALVIYALLAGFSSLFVTKDEFVHKEHCPASEQWLHALLFTLHPITLACAGFIWPVAQGIEVTPWIAKWLSNPEALRTFLQMQLGAMTLFFAYQVVYWNYVYDQQ
jgi:hypothetical protein